MLSIVDWLGNMVLLHTGWISGREAEYMETLTIEEVGETCARTLKEFLGKSIKEFPNLKKTTMYVEHSETDLFFMFICLFFIFYSLVKY